MLVVVADSLRTLQASGSPISATALLWRSTSRGSRSSSRAARSSMSRRLLISLRNFARKIHLSFQRNHKQLTLRRMYFDGSRQLEHFRGLSFPTISATGPNSSVVHYMPERETAAIVRIENVCCHISYVIASSELTFCHKRSTFVIRERSFSMGQLM